MTKKPTYEELERRIQEMAQAESERKRAEDKLRVSELWMRSIFNSLEEGVFVVSPDRKLANVNAAAERMFGYSKGELANQSTEILHIDHKHYLEFGRLINEAFDRDEAANFEFVAKRKNGEVFPTEHTASLLKNDSGEAIGIVSVVRDISERKQAEEALRESEDKYREFVEGTDDFVAQVDGKGRLTYINDKAEKVFGLSKEKCIGSYAFDFIHPDDRERTKLAFNEWIQQRISYTTFENRQVNQTTGEVYHMHWSINFHYDKTGNITNINSIARDLTERKQAEEEREKLINELQNALAQVKTLRGMLPICSHCKNIRDDKGYWNKIESYIHQHSDAEFSHSVCPECAKKYYPNLEIYED